MSFFTERGMSRTRRRIVSEKIRAIFRGLVKDDGQSRYGPRLTILVLVLESALDFSLNCIKIKLKPFSIVLCSLMLAFYSMN